MTGQDEPAYLLFALPPGGESASGVSVGEADTLAAAAEVIEGVLKPGETGVAVRPGKNKPEAAWLRTHGSEMRRSKISAVATPPKANAARHETVAYSGDAVDVLQDVLRSHLSPHAVAAIVAYLQPARTSNPDVDRQLRWLADRLTDLVGGPEQLDRLADELAL